MDNLFDDIIDKFGKKKIYLLYVLIIYVIILVGVVLYIWWPKEKEYLEYQSTSIESRQDELGKMYLNEMGIFFNAGSKEYIESLISDSYASYVGKSKEEIINELDKLGFFNLYSEVRGLELYVDGNTYVYSTTLYYKDNSRRLNIIEKYPYQYELTFDDFYEYNKVSSTTTNQNIEFTVKSVYRNLKYIKIEMGIENFNNTHVRFDFNTNLGVQAVLEDGKKYPIANLVSTESYTYLEPNTYINKTFVFEIPAQLQNGIKHIVFNGVTLEFVETDIKVTI